MKFSIRRKVILMILAFLLVLGLSSIFVSARVILNRTEDEYKTRSKQVVWTIADSIDSDRLKILKDATQAIYDITEDKVGSWDWGSTQFYGYLEKYKEVQEMDEYTQIVDYLRKMANNNNLKCLYFVFLDRVNNYCVYVADSAEEDQCLPGCIDELYEFNRYVLDKPDGGIEPYITNTEEYGWLVSSGAPVFAKSGELIGFIFSDLSMNEKRSQDYIYINSLIIYLAIAIVFILIISGIVVEFSLVRPIRKLNDTAKDYCNEQVTTTHDNFKKLKINTSDEIEELSESLKKMENDLNEGISNLIKTYDELAISKQHAREMVELARIDSLTGLENKTAYDSLRERLNERIQKGNAIFGMLMIDLNYLKKTNDTYGHDKGNESIIELSKIIKHTFVHSLSFRIGGDEFLVVLRNYDYDNSSELINNMKKQLEDNRNNETLDPWLKISAGIGYVEFNKEEDKDVDDVFKKADAEMYKNKKEVKKILESLS